MEELINERPPRAAEELSPTAPYLLLVENQLGLWVGGPEVTLSPGASDALIAAWLSEVYGWTIDKVDRHANPVVIWAKKGSNK